MELHRKGEGVQLSFQEKIIEILTRINIMDILIASNEFRDIFLDMRIWRVYF